MTKEQAHLELANLVESLAESDSAIDTLRRQYASYLRNTIPALDKWHEELDSGAGYEAATAAYNELAAVYEKSWDKALDGYRKATGDKRPILDVLRRSE